MFIIIIIIVIIITKPKDSSPDSQKYVYCDQFNTIQTNFTEERGIAEMYVQCNIQAHLIFAFWTLRRIVKT